MQIFILEYTFKFTSMIHFQVSVQSNMMDIVSLILLLFVGFVFWKLMRGFSHTRLPPGPKPWFLVGNLPELIIGSLHGKGDQLLRQLSEEYGAIMTLDVGLGNLRILIFDADLMKQAFIDKGRITSSRPYNYYLAKEVTRNKGILFNPKWTRPRNFVLKAVNGSILGASLLEKVVQDESLALCQVFKKKGAKPFDPFHTINLCMLNIISTLMFNRRYSYNEPQYEDILKTMTYMFRKNFVVNPINTIPVLRYLKYFTKIFETRKVLKSYDLIKKHIRSEVEKGKETFKPKDIQNLMDLYLSQENDELKDIDEENLIFILSELLLGGTYTNGVAVRWILLFLINYPEVQSKCREEIHKVLRSTDTPSLNHMKDLVYVQATINECLRLRSAASTNIIHSVDEDMKLGEYSIPKGASIQAILMVAHIDKETFGEDASSFRPERWISDDGKLKKFKEFMPFGLGKRQCVGENLAKKEMFIVTVSLLQRFTLKPVNPQNPPKIEGYQGFFNDPHRYNMVAEPCIKSSN